MLSYISPIWEDGDKHRSFQLKLLNIANQCLPINVPVTWKRGHVSSVKVPIYKRKQKIFTTDVPIKFVSNMSWDKGGLYSLPMMHCAVINYMIELVCDVITLKMDTLSKQLHQTVVFGEETDVIHSHSCDLNAQFDFTVPSLQFVRLNVVFGHFILSVFLVERPSIMLPANRRVSDKSYAVDSVRFLFIVGYWESSKESSVFFSWAEESFSIRNCSSRNLILHGGVLGLFWNATKNFEVQFFLLCGQQNFFFLKKFMYL